MLEFSRLTEKPVEIKEDPGSGQSFRPVRRHLRFEGCGHGDGQKGRKAVYKLKRFSSHGQGGSGDVLTGSLRTLAMGMDDCEAASLGVYVHGLAGEAAEKKYGVHLSWPESWQAVSGGGQWKCIKSVCEGGSGPDPEEYEGDPERAAEGTKIIGG
ncbi:MAG: hypothetical protein ACLU8D_09005 [Enterocloster sp.]